LNPNQPNQSRGSAQHRHRQAVGHEVSPAEPFSRADYQHPGQGGHTAGCVDHQSAGKIHHPETAKPAAAGPNPVTDRVVHQNGPQQRKSHKGHKPHPFGEGAGDQRRGDDGEHALVDHEHCLGNGRGVVGTWFRGYAVESEPGKITDKAADRRPERHRVTKIDPFDRDQRDHEQALHDRAQHVLTPDHACIKKRQAGSHEQHQSRRDNDEYRIRFVHTPSVFFRVQTGTIFTFL
jgi:hypothetical protein